MPCLQAALNLLPEQKVAWLRARRQLLTQLSRIWQQKRAISSEIQVCHASRAAAGPTGCTSALSLHTAWCKPAWHVMGQMEHTKPAIDPV